MWHFLSTVVDIVMPGVKEFKGIGEMGSVKGNGNGGMSFGFSPEVVGAWPEIEVNYDA